MVQAFVSMYFSQEQINKVVDGGRVPPIDHGSAKTHEWHGSRQHLLFSCRTNVI